MFGIKEKHTPLPMCHQQRSYHALHQLSAETDCKSYVIPEKYTRLPSLSMGLSPRKMPMLLPVLNASLTLKLVLTVHDLM
jgi:hypothetical protein